VNRALLAVRDLTRPGIEPVSFALRHGEAIHVSGPSGAGKTLLLRAVADLDPNDGDVRLEGIPRSAISAPAWRRAVRFVAAEAAWWADVAADHFIAPRHALERAGELGLEAQVFDKAIAVLSTGERQRLALVRALEDEPKVLLLDEPTAALDADSSRRAAELLERLLGRGAGLVVVAHDPYLAEKLGGPRFEMTSGRLAPA
jgi:ABC-type iron transport system FetAB ATPase subunit